MSQQPLAERLRPQNLDEYIGQKHLVGDNGVLRKFIATGSVPSFILWGPPGVGKTTLARIVASALNRPFYTLSAVTSGVKDVREVIEKAKNQHLFNARRPIFRRNAKRVHALRRFIQNRLYRYVHLLSFEVKIMMFYKRFIGRTSNDADT